MQNKLKVITLSLIFCFSINVLQGTPVIFTISLTLRLLIIEDELSHLCVVLSHSLRIEEPPLRNREPLDFTSCIIMLHANKHDTFIQEVFFGYGVWFRQKTELLICPRIEYNFDKEELRDMSLIPKCKKRL
jgi:hypothetical protein